MVTATTGLYMAMAVNQCERMEDQGAGVSRSKD